MATYKEQLIDETGGDIILQETGVVINIPEGALTTKQWVSVEIKEGNNGVFNDARNSTSVSPIVTCTTTGDSFRKAVNLRVSHCAVIDNVFKHEPIATTIKEYKGKLKRDTFPCRLAEGHCQISSKYLSNVEVLLQDVNKKRMKFVAFARGESYEGNSILVIRMWFINDLYSEYAILLQQQQKLGYCILGYGSFEISRSGEYLMKLKLQVNESNRIRKIKRIKNEMVFRKSKSCFPFEFKIQSIADLKRLSIKIFKGEDEGTPHLLVKEFDGILLSTLQRDQEADRMNEAGVTIADVLSYCEELSTILVTWSFSKLEKQALFAPTTIMKLSEIAHKFERRRNVKSATVITGSAGGMVGGILAVTGAALLPVTFGASAALIATGATLAVSGSAASAVVSLEKSFKDAKSKKEIETHLEEFQIFQTNFMAALAKVISIKETTKCLQRSLSYQERNLRLDLNPANVKNLIYKHDLQNPYPLIQSIPDILQEIICQSEYLNADLCIVKQTLGLQVPGMEKYSLDSMVPYKDVIYSFRLTYESNKNFLGFAIDYLQLKKLPAADIFLPTATILKAGGNAAASTGTIITRVGARSASMATGADVVGEIAPVFLGVEKIAKGFATASFVLGGIGIAADAAFLGHAIYELVKKVEISEGLRAVCDLMKTINDWQNLESS